MSKRSFDEMAADADISKNSFVLDPKFLETGEFSDLTIKHEDMEWKVHRVIVYSQSPYLATMAVASSTGPPVIDLSENAFEMVHRLVLFLYYGDYPYQDMYDGYGQMNNVSAIRAAFGTSEGANSDPEIETLLINTEMYYLSWKYKIPILGVVATRKYGIALQEKDEMTLEFTISLKFMYASIEREDRSLKAVALRFVAKNRKMIEASDLVSEILTEEPNRTRYLPVDMAFPLNDDWKEILFNDILKEVSSGLGQTPDCPVAQSKRCDGTNEFVRTNREILWENEGKYYCELCEVSFD